MNAAVAAALEKLDKALPDAIYRQSWCCPQHVICEPTLVIIDSPKPAITEALKDKFDAVVAARAGEADEPLKVAGGA